MKNEKDQAGQPILEEGYSSFIRIGCLAGLIVLSWLWHRNGTAGKTGQIISSSEVISDPICPGAKKILTRPGEILIVQRHPNCWNDEMALTLGKAVTVLPEGESELCFWSKQSGCLKNPRFVEDKSTKLGGVRINSFRIRGPEGLATIKIEL